MEHLIFIHQKARYIKINTEDIQFIEADGSYLSVFTKSEVYSLSKNLSEFAKQNQLPGLLRIHRSFMINIQCIDSFDYSFVYIGDNKIPIGNKFKEEFLKAVRSV